MKQCLLILLTLGALPLFSEPSCPLCEIHREYNKDHPGNYEYYEDYLKSKKDEGASKNASPPVNRKTGSS